MSFNVPLKKNTPILLGLGRYH